MMASLDHVLILIAGAVLTAIAVWRAPLWRVPVALAMWAAILFVRWPRFTAFDIVVGSVGSLSVTMMVVIAASALGYWGLARPRDDELRFAAVALIASGVVLYASAFGLTMFDAYRTGFSHTVPVVLSLAVIAWSAFKGWLWLPITMALVSIAHRLGALPSSNWWDYVMDPVLFVAAIVFLIIVASRRNRAHA